MPLKQSSARTVLASIGELVEELRTTHESLPRKRAEKLRADLDDVVKLLERIAKELGPVRHPKGLFDPALPATIGKLVSLALVAQHSEPLEAMTASYGSGVYAIYYRGSELLYAAISKKATPIYVGKADPKTPTAATPTEQGQKLFERLRDHVKAISKAEVYAKINPKVRHKLSVSDFRCRRLVCATNAQLVAEQYLIDMFKPIWNSSVRVCWGISKHGDSPDTRRHGRSPWDILHPGREWAVQTSTEKRSAKEIEESIESHFAKFRPYASTNEVIMAIVHEFAQ